MGADPFNLVQKTLAGAFLVESLVGEGRYSVVYRGRHIGPQETVAIKCLKLGMALDAPQAEAFLRRLREQSRDNSRVAKGHPNFARSIGSGMTTADDGHHVPYSVIEWLDGRSLASELAVRRIEQGAKGRSVADALALVEPAFEALAHAHAQGGLHGDVSAGNLFLSTGEGPRLRVLDYGVAKVVGDVLAEVVPGAAPERMFAAAYAAPEQFDSTVGTWGPWTDVYALALLFMELLRDRPVAESKVRTELAAAALDPAHRPTPSALGLSLSKEMTAVLEKAVAHAPAARWQNAGELLAALRGARSAAAVSTPQPVPRIDEWSPDEDLDTLVRAQARAKPSVAPASNQATVRLSADMVPAARIPTRPVPPMTPQTATAPTPPRAPAAPSSGPKLATTLASNTGTENGSKAPPLPPKAPSSSPIVAARASAPPASVGAGTMRVVPSAIPSRVPRPPGGPPTPAQGHSVVNEHPTPPPPPPPSGIASPTSVPPASLPPPPPAPGSAHPPVPPAPPAPAAAQATAPPAPPMPPPAPPAPPTASAGLAMEPPRSVKDLSVPPKAHVEDSNLPSVIVDDHPEPASANGVEQDASLRSRETVRLDRSGLAPAAPSSSPGLWPSAAAVPHAPAPVPPPPVRAAGPTFEERRARSRRRLLITALVSFLVVFVVGGGLLGAYFYLRAHPSSGIRVP